VVGDTRRCDEEKLLSEDGMTQEIRTSGVKSVGNHAGFARTVRTSHA
jgi:hypothetical protein